MLLGGEPFEEEIVMWWNFIGRSHEEIVEQREAWNGDGLDFEPPAVRGGRGLRRRPAAGPADAEHPAQAPRPVRLSRVGRRPAQVTVGKIDANVAHVPVVRHNGSHNCTTVREARHLSIHGDRWGRRISTPDLGGHGDHTNSRPRGVLYVHSAPSALCPHIEWAAGGVLGNAVSLEWTPQPAQAGTYRAEFSWAGEAGTAAAIASALRGWNHLRFEVTEEPTLRGTEGARFSYTPDLGVFHAVTGVHGDIMIPEDRLKAAVVKAALGDTTLNIEIDKLLGKPWDDELETFRHAGDGAPVRWLHQVV